MSGATQKTAFVFAGGGSLGAVQVGMLRELMRHGLRADFVVGSSVGALNAAYFASAPNAAGVDKLGRIWCGLRRHDVFPVTLRSLLRFAGGEGHLIDPSNLRLLIKRHIPFLNLEDASIPVHVIATKSRGLCSMSLIGSCDRPDPRQRGHSGRVPVSPHRRSVSH